MPKVNGEPARKKRKKSAVTTESLLEGYLLLKTAFDDTILRDELVEDLDIANGSGSGTSKTDKKKSLASHPALPFILKDLNEQRLAVRDQVKDAILAFAEAYDAQPLETPKYDVEPDEQKLLLQQHLSIQEAITKLKDAKKTLNAEVGALEKSIRNHEKRLTRAADSVVGKRAVTKKVVEDGSDSDA